MRKPHNEPERKCIITGKHGSPAALVRLAIGPDGEVMPDVRARAPGRGAWIGVDYTHLEAAIAKGKLKGALARAFKGQGLVIPDDLPGLTAAALKRTALDRLGLEARSSTLVTGADRISEAARKGKVHILLHASDAGSDGCRKLDQAWRVGTDQEGSGAQGLVLAADRAELSQALGRENVVHIGIIDARAADRVGTAISRWHHFIGHQTLNEACVHAAQGSSGGRANSGETRGNGNTLEGQ
jgi:uncharacterized protein